MTELPPPTSAQLRASAAICACSMAAGAQRLADVLDAQADRCDREQQAFEEAVRRLAELDQPKETDGDA